jgi:hypothetical protein
MSIPFVNESLEPCYSDYPFLQNIPFNMRGAILRFNLEHDFRQTNSIGAFGPLWRSTAFDLPFKNSVKSGGNGFS